MTEAFLLLLAMVSLGLAPVPAEKPHDPQEWGYLGVTVNLQTLQIATVEPNTPAAKAGLLPNDEFTKVGTIVPKTFVEVGEHISSFRPGSWMKVEVRRGNETKSFIVKLGVRPSDLPPPRSRPLPDGP